MIFRKAPSLEEWFDNCGGWSSLGRNPNLRAKHTDQRSKLCHSFRPSSPETAQNGSISAQEPGLATIR